MNMHFNGIIRRLLSEMAIESQDDIVFFSDLLNKPRYNLDDVGEEFDDDQVDTAARVLTSPGYKKALLTRFAQKTPHKFKIYVDDVNLYPLTDVSFLSATPNYISVIIGIDVGEPLTPWMLGHRIAHLIGEQPYRNQLQQKIVNVRNQTIDYLFQYKQQIVTTYLADNRKTKFEDPLQKIEREYRHLNAEYNVKWEGVGWFDWSLMLPLQPFNPSITSGVGTEEIFFDICAQYFKFGKVTFRCPSVETGRLLAVHYEHLFDSFLDLLVGNTPKYITADVL